jgi:hypothetical protein
MSIKFKCTASIALTALSFASVVGCVADRPARNGVYNENQYIRKDFLIRSGDSTSPDSGWLLKATVVEASEPNVFGDSNIFGLFSGSHSSGDLMHFVVTSDKLQMVSNREISNDPLIAKEATTEAAVMNAWPATNVDLKYRVNLDGETTNFYEENQELDWQVRQWVKVNFDKNDMSDLAPLGSFYTANIGHCSDAGNVSVTLVPNSFVVDETNEYMEWTVQITLPIVYSSAAVQSTDCMTAFGPMGMAAQAIDREYETVSLKYSMTRANATPSYKPLVVAEKDPIQRKYGPSTYIGVARDPNTGLLGANAYVTRFDPTKPIDWYFEEGFPTQYMPYFTSHNLPAGVSALSGVTTIEDATNEILTAAKAKAQVAFHQYNEGGVTRQFGDVRYNILRWLESEDQQSYFAGVTSQVVDPRNGETLSADIVFENFAIKDYYVAQIDAYLQSIGMSDPNNGPFDSTEWPKTVTTPKLDANGNEVLDSSGNPVMVPVACSATGDVGHTVPVVPLTLVKSHNGNSTLFQKIQGYLGKPVSEYGPLGPADFIAQHLTQDGQTDTDFYNAYYKYIPYIIYADPNTNPYVTPESGAANTGAGSSAKLWTQLAQEAQLHQIEGQLNAGYAPFNVNSSTGEADALTFANTYQSLTMNHRALNYAKMEQHFIPGQGMPITHADTPDAFAMVSMIERDGRHCVAGPEVAGGPTGIHWETKQEWIQSLINTYWSQVFWHEFGHAMGLEHNFMASVDEPNFPAAIGKNTDGSTRYPLYSSSVMEYNAAADRVFWTAGWGPYDKGALGWIYANANDANPVGKAPSQTTAAGPSGQLSSTYPWNDPNGFDSSGKNEHMFLWCSERHTSYTPLCRAGDIGTRPSEIVANDIDAYEWKYHFRNFRQYHKFFDFSTYGDYPMDFITESRRWLSLWAFDMGSSTLTQKFQLIGVNPPTTGATGVGGSIPAQTYYSQLTEEFNDEMDQAGSLLAAWHEAIVQQSAGARPYATTFDNYYGDVTQQGIILDKLDAIQSFTALWPVDNYDPTQSAGRYIASFATFGVTYNVDGTSIGSTYQTAAEQAVVSMLGGSWDAFEYAKPLAVAQFNFATHDPNYLYEYSGATTPRPEAEMWAGGYQFDRLQDFLTFFQNIAMQKNFKVTGEDGSVIDCTGPTLATCNYDPRTPQGYPQDTFYSNQYNQFVGPDGRRWIWAYFQDRNQYVACDQDRNIATYTQLYNYTSDVIYLQDDGTSFNAFDYELNVNYTLDYYSQSLIQQAAAAQ